jgi:hypothetical protein
MGGNRMDSVECLNNTCTHSIQRCTKKQNRREGETLAPVAFFLNFG